MSCKFLVRLIALISIVAFAFIATGCTKRQMVRQEESKMAAAEAPAPKKEAVTAGSRGEETAPSESVQEETTGKRAAGAMDLSSLRIQFAFNDYSLSTKARGILKAISAWMSKNPDVRIQIQGNTCDIGTAEYNLALGELRANSAKRYLEGLGISVNRLFTISYGMERPRVPNTNEGNRSLNRRDDFVPMKRKE